jgi:hypothetical protein
MTTQKQSDKRQKQGQRKAQEQDWRDESKNVVAQYIECESHPLLAQLTKCYRILEAAYNEGYAAATNWSLRYGNLIENFTPESEGKAKSRQWDYIAACTRTRCALERINNAVVAMQGFLPELAKLVKQEQICLLEEDVAVDDCSRQLDYMENDVALINIPCAVELLKLAIDIASRLGMKVEGRLSSNHTLHLRCRSALECFEGIPKMPVIKLKEGRRNYWKYLCVYFGRFVSIAWSGFGSDCVASLDNASDTQDEQEAQIRIQMILSRCKGWKAKVQSRHSEDIEPGLELSWPQTVQGQYQGRWWQNKMYGW